MKKLLLYGFGPLPIWASLIFLLVWRSKTYSSEFWAVGPWAIIAGAVLSTITFGIAIATIEVFQATKGDVDQKRKRSITVFLILVTVVVFAGASLYIRGEHRKKNAEKVQKLALDFVRHNAEIIRVTGPNPDISVAGTSLSPDGRPVGFTISVTIKRETYFATVEIEHFKDLPKFSLKCLQDANQHYSSNGRCE